jgi:hypothetical protein
MIHSREQHIELSEGSSRLEQFKEDGSQQIRVILLNVDRRWKLGRR